jgi:AcrR family transcriptional regulator
MKPQSDIAKRRKAASQQGDEDYNNRRRDIFTAAARVFRERGLKAANLADIASEAGMDRATLYYYVSGKDEIFHHVVRDAVLRNVESAEAIRDDGSIGPREKVAAFIRTLMQSYADHYPYLFVFVQENLSHLDNSTEWNREMLALAMRFNTAVIEMVQQGLDDGSFRGEIGSDADVIAYALIGMCNWSHRWFDPAGRRTAEEIGDLFAALALRGLLG